MGRYAGTMTYRMPVLQRLQVLLAVVRDTSDGFAETQKKTEVNRQAERLLKEHGNAVLRLAFAYLHNLSDAEDVLQDTLIRFLTSAPEFLNPQHERAWLLKVAANLSKNKLSYEKRRKGEPLDERLEETLADADDNELSFLWEAVKELPEPCRSVVHLFYFEGYATKQIAEILQIKESTVRSHLHRGRGRLKEILKEEYDFA